MTNRRAAVALGRDVALLVVFVAIGRRNHHEDEGLSGIIGVAGPFLIGLGAGWLANRYVAKDSDPMAVRAGVVIWACTVVVGLLLRKFAFDRGIATAFIIVATVTLGVFLLGWRAIARVVTSRSTVE